MRRGPISGFVTIGGGTLEEQEERRRRRQRRHRKSLRGLGIRATWRDLVTAEPRLQAFMDEALVAPGLDWRTCPDAVWYGWADAPKPGIKRRLMTFCGGETGAFYAAYRAIYGSMRFCRYCAERDPREADLELNLVRRLESLGIEDVRRQVKTAAGIADVVTPSTVFEVKLWLTRISLFQAVGQVSIYASELDRPNRAIVGQGTSETASLAEAVRKLGIKVSVW